MMRVRIVNERSDLTDLVAAAIKTTYNTRVPGEVERCLDVLKNLKSLSLSVKDLRSSDSISKLETLRRHRNPNIRKETQALFRSWSKTLYAHGSDNTYQAALTKSRLLMQKPVLKRCLELKTKEGERSLTQYAEDIKKNLGLLDSKKREEQRSQDDQAENESKTNFFEMKRQESEVEKETKPTEKFEAFTAKETKTDLKPLNLKRRGNAFTTKKPCGRSNYVQSSSSLVRKTKSEVVGNQKCYVPATALPQHSRHNITAKNGQVTTKALITSPRRDDVCKRNSGNPKSAALKAKTEKMVELFEAAKKAADLANVKGIILGKTEASRCVEGLSLLMRINITPNPREPRQMMKRLEGLTKHKDRKICNAASALLQLWKQRIVEQERKDFNSKTFPKTRKT